MSTCDHMRNMLNVLKAMQAVDFKNPKKVAKAKKEAKKQLKGVFEDDTIMCRVLTNIRVRQNGRIGWTCNLDGFIKNFDQFLEFPKSMKGKKYEGPCLFLGGQLSEYIP